MKKLLVIVGIVVGAAVVAVTVRAEKSLLPLTDGNDCLDCVHGCTDAASKCVRDKRNLCYYENNCMHDFRQVLSDCRSDSDWRQCLRHASEAFSACKRECNTQALSDCATAEEDCLYNCVNVATGNETVAPCANLCPAEQPAP
jgi:hypothetical protein